MWYAKTYSAVQAGSIDGTDTTPHDHGIARAEKAHYKKPSPDANLTKDPFKTLFVGRLGAETAESTLERAFERFGKILSVRIVRHVVTGESRGYGFVEYDRERDCKEAYKRMNKSLIDGHPILVDYERARVMEGWTPRRLGGGFGGRKESGQLRFGARDRPFKPPIYGHRGDHQAVPDIAFDQRYDDCWREHARRAATAGNQEASDKEPLRSSKSRDHGHFSQRHAGHRQSAAYQPSNTKAIVKVMIAKSRGQAILDIIGRQSPDLEGTILGKDRVAPTLGMTHVVLIIGRLETDHHRPGARTEHFPEENRDSVLLSG
ncbi:hypothetical protein SpCBS45565_g02102 [Spizellomyces sp. 'palustris']|nr:hypothetical protein SpCBS45565_g02102 [Spizellomyces sp. 'palustris']